MPTTTLQIPTTDGQADAFAAFPDHGERHPGGADVHGRAPSLRKWPANWPSTGTEAHTTERALRDADAYLRFLTTQPEVSAGPVAVIGYCIGGVLAIAPLGPPAPPPRPHPGQRRSR
jgi:carboxymethylenebutenolidase